MNPEELKAEQQQRLHWAELIRECNEEGDGYFDCHRCSKTGVIVAEDGSEQKCPRCNGYGLSLNAWSPGGFIPRPARMKKES